MPEDPPVDTIATSARVSLRPLVAEDAASYLRLVSDPLWARFIGPSAIRTQAEAEALLTGTLRDHYRSFGHGLWAVVERETGCWVGICGPLRRAWLVHPDLGFALLPEFRGRGLARSACELTLAWLEANTSYSTLQAILSPDNDRSHALLSRLGFSDAGMVTPPDSTQRLVLMARPLGLHPAPGP